MGFGDNFMILSSRGAAGEELDFALICLNNQGEALRQKAVLTRRRAAKSRRISTLPLIE
jgi:hypothetical protein